MAHLDDIERIERLFVKGYPFQRYARRVSDPVSMALTPYLYLFRSAILWVDRTMWSCKPPSYAPPSRYYRAGIFLS